MATDTSIKLAIYRHFATHGTAPTPDEMAEAAGVSRAEIEFAYQRLREQRVLVVEPDGRTIRMASPFSGVQTQHVVESAGVRFWANCAWDALGIVAALRRPGTVRSRCEQTMAPLELEVGVDGPEPCDWLFQSLVPAAHWWDDIVFT